MNTTLTAAIICACLCGAVLLGMRIRRFLPEHHLKADTRDAVKGAVGLIATMSALLLGLLVNSAKGSYDTIRSELIQLAAKTIFLERVLVLYGSETAPLRMKFRAAVQEGIQQLWSPYGLGVEPDLHVGDALYADILGLPEPDEAHRNLKNQALSLAVELAQIRTLLHAQSLGSIPKPLLGMVVLWFVIILFSFTLLAPSNATATFALLVSAISVSGAIFLILEMERPFAGLLRIPSEPLVKALSQVGK